MSGSTITEGAAINLQLLEIAASLNDNYPLLARIVRRAADNLATQLPSDEHLVLMQFYGVSTMAELADSQNKHIEGLQNKINNLPAVTAYREGRKA